MSDEGKTRESSVSLVDAVLRFMTLGGQSTGKFDAHQAGLYTGLQFEELAEKIEAIAEGAVTPSDKAHLLDLAVILRRFEQEFKRGHHYGAILRSTHAKIIDADFDIAFVSLGSLASVSPFPRRAVAHGVFTNLDKFRDGKVLRDEKTGKVLKPEGWVQADFTPYVDTLPLA